MGGPVARDMPRPDRAKRGLRTRVGGMGLARFYQVSMTSPSQIPAPPAPRDAAHVSITAMADLHFGRFATEMYAPVLTAAASTTDVLRSEERRVGKECRSRA